MATDHPGPQPQVRAVLSEVVGGRAGAGHLVGRRHVVQHLLLGGGRVLEAARRRVPRVMVGHLAVGRQGGGGILFPENGLAGRAVVLGGGPGHGLFVPRVVLTGSWWDPLVQGKQRGFDPLFRYKRKVVNMVLCRVNGANLLNLS